MRLPGPLGWISLASSVALASAPAAMGVISVANGNLLVGGIFLAIAAVMFALPEYVVRSLPGPKEFVRRHRPRPVSALKNRLFGRARSDRPDRGEEE